MSVAWLAPPDVLGWHVSYVKYCTREVNLKIPVDPVSELTGVGILNLTGSDRKSLIEDDVPHITNQQK
jgi:hypothetical protein